MSTATHPAALRSVVLSLLVHAAALYPLLHVATDVGGESGSPAPLLAAFVSVPDDALPEPSDDPSALVARAALEADASRPLPLELLVPDDDPPESAVPFLDAAAPVGCARGPGIQDLTLPADAFRLRSGRRPSVPPAPAVRDSAPASAPPRVHPNVHTTARRPDRRTARAGSRREAPLRTVHVPDVRDYYPRRARRRGVEGVVLVEIEIDSRGRVVHARVVRSSGDASLDAAGVRLARDVRFARGDRGRRRAHLPVVFDLE